MSRQRMRGVRWLERLEELPVWESAARRHRPGTRGDRAEVDRRAAAKRLDVARRRARRNRHRDDCRLVAAEQSVVSNRRDGP